MSFDQHKDLAYSTIPVGGAPSPATTGNSLKVASAADRALFPTPPFQATVWPPNTSPVQGNAEIIQVNGTTGTDGFRISRGQGDSSAQAIVAGWQIAATITKKPFTDLEAAATGVAYLGTAETFTSAQTFNAGAFLDKGNVHFDVKAYGAVGDGILLSDGVMNLGSPILTSATATFTASDIGKPITVRGAGASGNQLNLITTIKTWQSATQVTLNSNASVTIAAANVAYGTDNHTAFQGAINAATTGGIIYIPPGAYLVASGTEVNKDGITVQGAGRTATTIITAYAPSFGSPAPLRWNTAMNYTYGRACDISFNLNYIELPAIHVRTNGGATKSYKNLSFQRLEFYNRAPDNSGARGALLLDGDYNDAATLNNVTIEDCEFRDGVATDATYISGYSIGILSKSLSRLLIKNCYFHDVYGSTIAHNNANGRRTCRDWVIEGCTFINTVRQNPTSATSADFFNVTRDGYQGIKFVNNYFQRVEGLDSDDRYTIAIYNSTDLIISGNTFIDQDFIIAPGHSFPFTNESFAWTFTDNIVRNCRQLADPDGHFIGTYTNNTLYNVNHAFGFAGGYGRHTPTVVQDNLYVNVNNAPNAFVDWSRAVFVTEDAEVIFRNNTVYFDPAMIAPSAPSVADAGTSGNLIGTYYYKITFLGTYSETEGGTSSASVTVSRGRVALTNIPLGPTGCTARRIWRTGGNKPDGSQQYVGILEDNTTTTYTDNIADSSLNGVSNAQYIMPKVNNTGCRAAYMFYELTGTGHSNNMPNIYSNNTMLGDPVSKKTFKLDSTISHIITSNHGVVEDTIDNSFTGGTTTHSNLASSDIIGGNFKADGTPVNNSFKGTRLRLKGTTSPDANLSGYADLYYEGTAKQLYFRDESGNPFTVNMTAGTSTSTSSTSSSTSSTSTSSTSISTSSTSTSNSTSVSSTSHSTSSTSSSTSSTSSSISTSSTSTSHSTSSTSTSTTVIAFG